jgi:hypothetical protein
MTNENRTVEFVWLCTGFDCSEVYLYDAGHCFECHHELRKHPAWRRTHELGGGHQLAVGTEVTYSPTYASNLPRDGWKIDCLPPESVYVIRHPNGSVIAAAKGELQMKSGEP